MVVMRAFSNCLESSLVCWTIGTSDSTTLAYSVLCGMGAGWALHSYNRLFPDLIALEGLARRSEPLDDAASPTAAVARAFEPHEAALARLPAAASIGMMIRKRPMSIAMPIVPLYQGVFAFKPAKALPLFPVALA